MRKLLLIALGLGLGVRVAAAAPRAISYDEARAAAAGAPDAVVAHGRTSAAAADAAAAGPWPATAVQVGTGVASPRLVGIAVVPLPIVGRERAARRAARAQAIAVRADEDVAGAEARLAAAQAWIELWRAERIAALAAQAAERMAALEDVTRKRRAAGDVADAEVVTSATQATRARIEAADRARAIAVASAELAAALGLDPEAELATAGEPPRGADGDDDPAGAAGAASIERHPMVRAAAERRAAAEAAIAAARAEGRPAPSVELEVDALDGDAPPALMVKLGLELPLFGRGAQRIAAARAASAAEAVATGAAQARIGAALVIARRRWAAAGERARALHDEVMPAQERSTSLVRASYAAGESDLASVILAERDLLDVAVEQVEADAALAGAWASYEDAAGGAP